MDQNGFPVRFLETSHLLAWDPEGTGPGPQFGPNGIWTKMEQKWT